MIIVLQGNDQFRIRERCHVLRQAFINKYDPQQLNVVQVDLQESDPSTLHQQLTHQGLFAQRRFIILRGIETAKAKLATIIANELATVPSDSIVVCIVPAIEDLPKDMRMVVEKAEKIESFPELDAAGIQQWIRQHVKSFKAEITPVAIQAMSTVVGNNLWQAHSLISMLVQANKRITPELVQQYSLTPIDDNIFHFTDAIATQNAGLALQRLHDQLQAGAHPIYLLTILARQVSLLIQVKETPQAVKAHPYVVRKAQQHAKKFTLLQLQALHAQLTELDWQCKQNQNDPMILLDRWVVEATVPKR